MKRGTDERESAPHRVLTTGAAGFVGKRLTEILLERGHEVHALDISGTLEAASSLLFVRGDVRDEASLDAAIDGCDAVIHLAALTSDERASEAVNVGGTANLIAACRRTGARRMIYLSTQADPRGAYGRTKCEGERLVRESELDWTICKPNLIYGSDKNGAFAKVARAVMKAPVIPITGPARAKFWPIHVDDGCLATAICLEKERTIGKVFVLAGRDGASLTELVDMIAATLGKRAHMFHLPLWFSLLAARLCVFVRPDAPPISVSNVLGCNQNDVDHDITAMVDELGVEPRPLRQGLREVIARLAPTRATER